MNNLLMGSVFTLDVFRPYVHANYTLTLTNYVLV
jgi:hypothetical protein